MKYVITMLLIGMSANAALAQTNQKAAQSQTVSDSAQKSLVPSGYGTLKQDEFTLGIRNGALLVKVTPLNESVIRLAAPDTYNRLHALAASRMATAMDRTGSQQPELFLVSFFSYQPDVTFNPEDVQIEYHGKLMRPSAIIPLTPSWGQQRMGQQQTQAAVYVFADAIDFQQPVMVHYGIDVADWQPMIPKLEVERTKVLSRLPK